MMKKECKTMETNIERLKKTRWGYLLLGVLLLLFLGLGGSYTPAQFIYAQF